MLNHGIPAFRLGDDVESDIDESKTMEMDFDQVILAVGQRVEPGLAGYLETAFGRGDRLEVDGQTMRVKDRDQIFSGGDIVRGPGTVVEAVADGRRAAMGIDKLLRKRKGESLAFAMSGGWPCGCC